MARLLLKDLCNVNQAQYDLMINETIWAMRQTGKTEQEQAQAFQRLREKYAQILGVRFEP